MWRLILGMTTLCLVGCGDGFRAIEKVAAISSQSLTCTPNAKQSCQIANGTGSQTCNATGSAWGACGNITSCNSGFNLQNGSCIANACSPNATQSCSVSNGTGSQACNASGTAWGACSVSACNSGYTLFGGSCYATTQSCSVANGTGIQTFQNGSYGSCQATSCNAGSVLRGGSCYSLSSIDMSAQGTLYPGPAWPGIIWSYPIPVQGAKFSGISGKFSFDAINGTGPMEVLVQTFFVPAGNCPASGTRVTPDTYASIMNSMPDRVGLTSNIVKGYGSEHAEIDVGNFQLPTYLPISGCVFLLAGGGTSTGPSATNNMTSMTITSSLKLNITTQAADMSPYQIGGVGDGDEFCFGMTAGCEIATTQQGVSFASSWRVPTSGTVLALFGNVSQGSITPPSAPWNATHEWYVDHNCSGLSPGLHGPSNYFAQIPAGSTVIHTVSMNGSQNTIQQAVNQLVNVPVNAGDCIVHLVQVNSNGQIDAETQVAALIQPGHAPISSQSVRAAAVVTSDGHPTLFSQASNGDVTIWATNGTNVNGISPLPNVASGALAGWKLVATADLNGDGKPDLIWQNTNGDLSYWLMNGLTATSMAGFPGIASGSLAGWQLAATADLNGDGKVDFIWQNSATGDITYWLMNGVQVTAMSSFPGVANGSLAGWKLIGAADLNGDGNADLIWQNSSTGDISYWAMSGVNLVGIGSFPGVASGSVAGWQLAATADLNGDGHPDLIWQNLSTGNVNFWLMNGVTVYSSGPLQ